MNCPTCGAHMSCSCGKPTLPYPPGMQADSQRLHREYRRAVAAGDTAAVVRVTDEAGAKGIVLVPGGELL